MPLLAADPLGCDEIGRLEDREVLSHRLPRHREPTAELTQRLPVRRVKTVEQEPPAGIGQGAEDGIVVGHGENMQLIGCLLKPRRFASVGTRHTGYCWE